MSKTLTKIKDVEYNELVTLVLLYRDKRLWNIFKDELKLPINTLITIAKNNGLSLNAKDILKSIFEEVISIDSIILSNYEKLLTDFNDNSEDLIKSVKDLDSTPYQPKTEKTAEIVAEIKEPVKAVTEKKPTPEKKKVNRKLPRRIGKEAIDKMVKDNGGQAKQVHRLMYRINDLKNLYVKLQARGIKELSMEDGSVLSDDECRTISSAITILEQKVSGILKKK